MLRFDIITIFPNMFSAITSESIIKRAQNKKKARIDVHDLRKFSKGKYRQVDDRPFGGGPGMVLMPEPLFKAVKKIKGRRKAKVILTCAAGKPLTQKKAQDFAKEKNLIIICGHYEGVDERVREELVDESISIGDYVLTGGEVPAMVIIDAVTRLIPGVLGKDESVREESFCGCLLEYPQYTRPANFQGKEIPHVLLSGNHKAIQAWRQQEALKKTRKIRPDLLK